MAASVLSNSAEAMEIISTIRALTVSQKEMTSDENLMRDYKQLNGEGVPYRKFGFKSLEQFLLASSEFLIRRNAQGGISISAKPSKESSHIVDLIKKQKSTTGKKKRARDFRRPQSTDQSWHKTQYSNAYWKMPSPQKTLQSMVRHRSSSNSSKSLNNNTNIMQNRNLPATNKENLDNFQSVTTKNIKAQDVRIKGREDSIKERKQIDRPHDVLRQNSREKIYQPIVPEPLQQQKQQDVKEIKVPSNNTQNTSNTNKIPPLLNNNTHTNKNNDQNRWNNNVSVGNSLNDSNRNKLQSRIDMANAIAKHEEIASEFNKKITIKNDHSDNIPQLMSLQVTIPTQNYTAPMLKSSLQDRLIVKKPMKTFSISAPSTTTSPTVQTPTTPLSGLTPPILANSAFPPLNITAPEELELYCSKHKLARPIYSTFKMGKNSLFNCKVSVNEKAYTTYPNEFLTEFEAQSAAARIALEELKDDVARNLYPTCVESDFNIAIKIYNKLKEYPCGVFSSNFPDMFQETYKLMLPDKWFSIVVSSPQLFSVEETTPSIYILFAVVADSDSSSVSTTSDSESTLNSERLALPWHSEQWNLYITNPVSTVQIWARLLGEEYSEKMDSLLNDIEMAMLTEKQRTQTIQIGYIYLVSVSDCWYRVRVNEINFEQNRCLCFFIDVGDEEWFSMDQLFVCHSRFLKCPAQAIPFTLFGLEDFDENPQAKYELVDLEGRILIGKVYTKQEEYEMHEESSNFDARIKVVLYDTSSDEDLNLNPIILKKICENTPAPIFNRTTVTHVNITHINDNGDIYCQIIDSGIYYIEKLIYNLTESKLNEEFHCGLYQKDRKSSANQYYLIYDENDKKWYRAIIESFSTVEDEYRFYYVDYGISRVLRTKRLLRTDSLSAALHSFPNQALKIRLAGIPNMNLNTVARLKGLLKPISPAIIKILTQAAIPLVNVYTRFQHNNVLFCVNETIRLEQEMEQSSDIKQSVANFHLNLTTTTNSATITLPSTYRSIQNNKSNSSSGNSPESIINELSVQLKNVKLKSSNIKPAVHPPIGELTYFRVLMASNPHNFIIQPHKDSEKLLELMTELQTYCKDNKEFIPSDCVKVGEVYGALHTDGSWYRATVEKRCDLSMICVFFCDFGEIEILSSDRLKILPLKFRSLPRQATKAKLHGIKPKNRDWSLEDCLYFQKLTVNKIFASIIRSIVDDEMYTEQVELVLIDVSGETDIIIHELLIKENRAVPC